MLTLKKLDATMLAAGAYGNRYLNRISGIVNEQGTCRNDHLPHIPSAMALDIDAGIMTKAQADALDRDFLAAIRDDLRDVRAYVDPKRRFERLGQVKSYQRYMDTLSDKLGGVMQRTRFALNQLDRKAAETLQPDAYMSSSLRDALRSAYDSLDKGLEPPSEFADANTAAKQAAAQEAFVDSVSSLTLAKARGVLNPLTEVDIPGFNEYKVDMLDRLGEAFRKDPGAFAADPEKAVDELLDVAAAEIREFVAQPLRDAFVPNDDLSVALATAPDAAARNTTRDGRMNLRKPLLAEADRLVAEASDADAEVGRKA